MPRRDQILAERLALYFQAYTLYSSVRPFGLSALVAGWDAPASVEGTDELVEKRPQGQPALYMVEPSGTFWVRFLLQSVTPRSTLKRYPMHRGTAESPLEKENSKPRLRSRNSTLTT